MSKLGRGIYLRGSVYWLAVQENGKRRHLSLKTKDPVIALRNALKARHSPELAPSEGFTRDVEKFLAHKTATDRYSKRTLEWSEGVLKQFGAHVSNKAAGLVRPEDVTSFYAMLRQRMTENGAHSYMRAVKSFFSWCVEQRIQFESPAKAVKLGKPSQPARLRFASKTQRDQLITSAPNDSMRFILYCAFHAGMRFNEITEARPEWFNLKGRFITVETSATFKPKNRRTRTIPISTPFLKFLKTYKLRSPFMLEPAVTHGKYRYRYDFSLPWRRHMATNDLSWITPHTARHTFASLLVMNGESLYKVAKWLGDTLKVAEAHYAHLEKDDRSIDRML